MATQADKQNPIVQIAMNYFKKQTGSEQKAEKLFLQLAKVVQDDGAKLVHLGNVLFLVLVRGKGVVEIHTIGDESPMQLAEDFKQLAAYLKNIDVKIAYTYADDARFGRLAKMTGLPVKEYKMDVEGKPKVAYVMEF